jgi:hypothetical protein
MKLTVNSMLLKPDPQNKTIPVCGPQTEHHSTGIAKPTLSVKSRNKLLIVSA